MGMAKQQREAELGEGAPERQERGACSQHEALEGAAELASAWLCASRPALQQCKQRAAGKRLKNGKGCNAAAGSSSGGDAAT